LNIQDLVLLVISQLSRHSSSMTGGEDKTKRILP
jgi:hypothetical protein